MPTAADPKEPVRREQRSDGRGNGAGKDRPPWHVEGARPKSGLGRMTDDRGRPRPSFWTVLLVALLVNWVISSMLLAEDPRVEVPYTFFRAQVEAGNVSQITSTEDAIEGRFKAKVKYPPGEDGTDVDRFSTYRPSFADDDLFQLLADKGVEVDAKPPPGPSFLERLLVGFGPTLIGLLFYAVGVTVVDKLFGASRTRTM